MCHGDRATASGPGPGDNTGLASEADDRPRTSCLPRRGATRLASIETARLAGILHGLTQAGFTVPVVGVVAGADPVKRLDKWAPIRWRDLCTLVRTHVDDFRKPARVTRLGGVELDPIFEGKCLPFLKPGDLFWVVGIR